MWRYIVDSGVKPDQPDFLQDQLRLTNIIGLIIGLLVGGGFAVLSYFLIPELVWIPGIGALAAAPAFLYNRLGLRRISRFVIAVVPCVLVNGYNGFLTDSGNFPLYGIGMISLGFAMLPLVVFAYAEYAILITSLLINLAVVLTLPYYEGFLVLETTFNREIFETGWMRDVSTAVGMVVAFSNMFLVVDLNRKKSRRLQQILAEANEKNEALQVSQTKAEKAIDELGKTQDIEKGRQWIAEGNSDVNGLLREHQSDLAKGYNKLISFIVKYLNAQQGAIFVAEEVTHGSEEIVLKQRGGYALGKERYRGFEIQPGEGIAGTVYVENKPIILEELPGDFLRISSGLGDERPIAGAVYPMQLEGTVEGVIEIYSFTPFDSVQKEFLKRVSDTIGSNINIARANDRIKELLETSLQQTEELRAQEEEMRQNTEELLATQEEMKRKEQEYIKEIEDLRGKLGN